jgi:hypothetical protein
MAKIKDHLITIHFGLQAIASDYTFSETGTTSNLPHFSKVTLTEDGVKGNLGRLEFSLPFCKLIEAGDTKFHRFVI